MPPPAPAPPAEAPLAPPGREAPQEVQSEYAPKSLAQLVGTWAYSAADCERLFQRRGGRWAYREPVDKFAQAAIVELPKKILLPSAICRIEGASLVEGMLKVNADCEDSISFTPRSVMITLRSTTELVYSASGELGACDHLEEMRAVTGNDYRRCDRFSSFAFGRIATTASNTFVEDRIDAFCNGQILRRRKKNRRT